MYDYLLHEHDIGIFKKLLFSENKRGLRPLELASEVGAYGLVSRIFQTDDIYKKQGNFLGCFKETLYDVTEYETTRKTIYDFIVIV